MSARLWLLWYHARLSLSWAALTPPLALAATLAYLALFMQVPDRGYNLARALEGGLPLVAALLATPLLLVEGERGTLCWLAARASLARVVALRLALLALYLLALCALALLAAHRLWGGPSPWESLPHAAAPALAFAALALCIAHWGRTPVHGYLPAVALWAGVLMFGALLPHREPWLTLNPFAWSNGYSPEVVARGKWLDLVIGLALLLAQWPLLRPERLLRQT